MITVFNFIYFNNEMEIRKKKTKKINLQLALIIQFK